MEGREGEEDRMRKVEKEEYVLIYKHFIQRALTIIKHL